MFARKAVSGRHEGCSAATDLYYLNSSVWRPLACRWVNCKGFISWLCGLSSRSRAGLQTMHASRIFRQFSAHTSLPRTLRALSRHVSWRQQGARLQSTATLTYEVKSDQKGTFALRCQPVFCASL